MRLQRAVPATLTEDVRQCDIVGTDKWTQIYSDTVAVHKGGCSIHMFGRSGYETAAGNNKSAGLLYFMACRPGTFVFARNEGF
jgi:hypothetical protein